MSYLISYTGKRIDLPNPNPANIDIVDVATHLSRIPRFVGSTDRFFSVAQHSVVVAYLAVAVGQHYSPPPHLEFTVLHTLLREGLLHDAHEAYMGDVPSPLKSVCAGFKSSEGHIDRAVRQAFSMANTMPPHVKTADRIALILESGHLRGPDRLDMTRIPQEVKDLVVKLARTEWFKLAEWEVAKDWPCETAKDKFLEEWDRLES